MSGLKVAGGLLVGALTLSMGLAAAPEEAQAATACGAAHAQLGQDPLAGGLTVLESRELDRFRARPYQRVAHGVVLTVQAPAGVTEADLHGALACSKSSVLSVDGAKLQVRRSGAAYEVRITAEDPTAAREIQRRAASLR